MQTSLPPAMQAVRNLMAPQQAAPPISFQPPEARAWSATSRELDRLWGEALQKAREEQAPRDYLGGSVLAEECLRKLGYLFHKAKPAMPDGRALRIFERGHDAEARMIRFLERAGFQIQTRGRDGRQLGFKVAGGRIGGNIDGLIVTGPFLPGVRYPCLVEFKCLNDKNWRKLHELGVKNAKPVYYGQCQIYMAYMDLTENPALFLAENADTCEIHAEPIPFDVRAAQVLSDKGVRIVTSGRPEELPRITRDGADFRCRFCDFRAQCWTP